ncbi:MAG TPA: uroporphyrinogen decarboxylase family protein, partial [Burkholderiales bacterium]|nr:uroporphyrinogen decarboxylase family protein [Burkholderiales bacterium]
SAIQREARAILASYGKGSGHVFNLGHGISQHTPPENVSALIEAVRGFSVSYH